MLENKFLKLVQAKCVRARADVVATKLGTILLFLFFHLNWGSDFGGVVKWNGKRALWESEDPFGVRNIINLINLLRWIEDQSCCLLTNESFFYPGH